jgi:hypothetical protein
MVADDRALVSRGVVQLAAQRTEFSREQVELIRRTVAAGTTETRYPARQCPSMAAS